METHTLQNIGTHIILFSTDESKTEVTQKFMKVKLRDQGMMPEGSMAYLEMG